MRLDGVREEGGKEKGRRTIPCGAPSRTGQKKKTQHLIEQTQSAKHLSDKASAIQIYEAVTLDRSGK